jgi:hypothetical protein
MAPTSREVERCKADSPGLARKEVAAHLLAYNLIRGIMAEAARGEGIASRRLSLKGPLHTGRQSGAVHLDDPQRIERDLPRLVSLIGRKHVGDRPDRYQRRAVKRQPKPYPFLRMTRKREGRGSKGSDPLERSLTL